MCTVPLKTFDSLALDLCLSYGGSLFKCSLFADCTLSRREKNNNLYFKKTEQKRCFLSPLECIAVVEVSVAVLLLLSYS